MVLYIEFCFFFSSRRRHTRYWRDWSSDVCSSDLFVIRVEGRFAGQVTIDNVVRGALRSGNLGYWIDRAVAGRGMASLAVSLVCDHAFGPARLHRLQADIRPENGPSRGLVHRLGFRHEGLLRRYLDIDGDWRDHDTFALLAEDVPGGVVERWRSRVPR